MSDNYKNLVSNSSRKWYSEQIIDLSEQCLLQKLYENDSEFVEKLDEDQYFKDADFSTIDPYKTFLMKGGFRAFPNVVLIRIDVRGLRDINPIDNTFNSSVIILMTKLDNKNKCEFKSHMRNCMAGETAHVNN